VCGIILLFRKARPAQWPKQVGLAAIVLVAVLAPWTYRNWEQFHRIIPLRSNFGLELAIAFHSAAVNAPDPSAVFHRRLASLHPLRQSDASAFLRANGGEVGYSQHLEHETLAWIREHPVDSVSLAIGHLRQYYFPPQWFWIEDARFVAIKQAIIWAISLFGLIGAALALVRWRGPWSYVAVLATVTSLPYSLVQPIIRYYYIVYPFLLLLAGRTALGLFCVARREFTKKRPLKLARIGKRIRNVEVARS
jgi:hypothetical protein